MEDVRHFSCHPNLRQAVDVREHRNDYHSQPTGFATAQAFRQPEGYFYNAGEAKPIEKPSIVVWAGGGVAG